MQIQPKIKARMKLLGIKSRELAPILGITEPNLSQIITGKTKSISYTMLGKLCEALDCQPNDLLEVPDMSSFKDVEQTTDCAPAANISQIIKTYEALLTGENLPERIAVPTTVLQALLEAAKPVDVAAVPHTDLNLICYDHEEDCLSAEPAQGNFSLGWVVRERRGSDGELLDCFVEAPRCKEMPYALEVLGDDYTGYGDQEAKLEHCKMIVAWANAASTTEAGE